MTDFLNVISYSCTGRDHVLGPYQGNGNQDCYGYRQVEKGLIAASVDGCGSRPDSATGARAAVRIVLNVGEKLLGKDEIPSPEEFCTELQDQILKRVRAAALPLCQNGDVTDIVDASYLFTLLIAVCTPTWTAVFGCGDGIFAVNGKVEKLLPRAANHPEYLCYLLWNPVPPEFTDVALKVLWKGDTVKINSIFVGTDGTGPLLKLRQLKGKSFQLADLWNVPSYRHDPNAAKAILDELGQDRFRLVVEENPMSVTVRPRTEEGIFDDDMTFVCLVRATGASLPEAWRTYRLAHLPAGQADLDPEPYVPVPVEAPSAPPVYARLPVTTSTTPRKQAPAPVPEEEIETPKRGFFEWLLWILKEFFKDPVRAKEERNKSGQNSARTVKRPADWHRENRPKTGKYR